MNELLCLDSKGSCCISCASKPARPLCSTANLVYRPGRSGTSGPVCSHEGYSNFSRSPGRAVSSEKLCRIRRHQSSWPRVVWAVCRCRRRCKGERRQRGSYGAPNRQKPCGRPALSWTSQDTSLANKCQEKSVVEYCGFLANRPSRSSKPFRTHTQKYNQDTDTSLLHLVCNSIFTKLTDIIRPFRCIILVSRLLF